MNRDLASWLEQMDANLSAAPVDPGYSKTFLSVNSN
jgi:hypothetical protein